MHGADWSAKGVKVRWGCPVDLGVVMALADEEVRSVLHLSGQDELRVCHVGVEW